MDLKRLQKKVDQALALLSDHDDKKSEDRYINLRDKIQETEEYIEGNNHTEEISIELYNELKKCMKEFEEKRFIFIIFLIILCGILFVGVFYITYSHFYDWFHPFPGGHIKPPHHTRTTLPSTSTTSVTKTTYTTKSTNATKVTTTVSVIKPDEEDDTNSAFVTVLFDKSSLIDLKNLIPVKDEIGLKSVPTTWSLSSQLSGASKDYIVKYTIDFVDANNDIDANKLMDINNLKFSLVVKNKDNIVFNSGVQLFKDYPEIELGRRNIITLDTDGNTFKNGETLDFELRIWLDSDTDNRQQGKIYQFNILVDAVYDFID